MAKTAKKAKAKAKKAASPATPAPPPAKASPKGEPAGGWLQWRQTSNKEWLADDPVDKSRPGARISVSSQAWKGKGEEPLYAVYRNAVDSSNTEYLGTDGSLEAAQRRAQYREKSASALTDTVPGGGMPAFLNLTERERAAARDKAPARPSPPEPRKPKPPAPAAPAAPAARGNGQAPPADPAQDQPPTAHARVDVAARVGLPAAAAPKLPKVRASKIPGTAIIRVVTKVNPRRAGTGQHVRYEQILAHDGKTVAEYVAAGGHLDALGYAVAGNHVTLEGS